MLENLLSHLVHCRKKPLICLNHSLHSLYSWSLSKIIIDENPLKIAVCWWLILRRQFLSTFFLIDRDYLRLTNREILTGSRYRGKVFVHLWRWVWLFLGPPDRFSATVPDVLVCSSRPSHADSPALLTFRGENSLLRALAGRLSSGLLALAHRLIPLAH
jgi:hypothetical protein